MVLYARHFASSQISFLFFPSPETATPSDEIVGKIGYANSSQWRRCLQLLAISSSLLCQYSLWIQVHSRGSVKEEKSISMEDAFVSFVSSCLLEPDRDVHDKVDEEGEDDHEIEDDICDVLVPYSHDVLVPLRDRAFSWDVKLENEEIHPDVLLGSTYKPRVLLKTEGHAHIKEEESSDAHDAPHLLDEELFGDDLLPHPSVPFDPHPQHSRSHTHPDMPPPTSSASKPPRARIRVTLKADSPPPPSNSRGLRANNSVDKNSNTSLGSGMGIGMGVGVDKNTGIAGASMGMGVGSNVNIIARSTSRSKLSEADATMRASGGLYHPIPTTLQHPGNTPAAHATSPSPSGRMNSAPSSNSHSSNNNSNGTYASGYVTPTFPHPNNSLGPHTHSYPNATSPANFPAGLQPISALNSSTIIIPGGEKRVGAYSVHERRCKIEKFRERKRARIWRKQIKYDCRKRLADTRPRVKGRFVSRKKLAGGGGASEGDGGNEEDDDEGDVDSPYTPHTHAPHPGTHMYMHGPHVNSNGMDSNMGMSMGMGMGMDSKGMTSMGGMGMSMGGGMAMDNKVMGLGMDMNSHFGNFPVQGTSMGSIHVNPIYNPSPPAPLTHTYTAFNAHTHAHPTSAPNTHTQPMLKPHNP